MAGTIEHQWNGTVLTITSDSGTSSADLKGEQGKAGIRGPQGRAGVILKEDGSVDMSGYATEAYVIEAIDVALEDYTPSGGGGGGGGGTSNNAELTLKSTTGWTYKAISETSSCFISGTWSSIEDELPTGNGTITIYVDNAVKLSKNIPQGDFNIDIAKYLNSGSNTVRVKVTDVYGNASSLAYTVNKLVLTITSTFDDTVPYAGAVDFTYTPNGNATKTVHFILDGTEIANVEVTTSGRQKTFTIPAQSHGSHTFEVYFTADIDGEPVPSNHLLYDIIFINSGVSTPVISCSQQELDVEQFETINIYYVVYNPSAITATVVLKEDGEQIGGELTVDRSQQTWAYRADKSGEVILTITCGNTVKTIILNVTESNIDVTPTTDSQELYLTSYGRSNNSLDKDTWSYEDISCSFSNYNWVSDGWQLDDKGITVHRVTGDARLTIPFKMFETDFRTTGKTIEFEFATKDVRDYDAEVITCYSGDIGLKITAQKALLKSSQSEISTQYKDNEHIRLSFVVEKKAENRLILIYLNGIMCGAVQYPENDNFAQSSAVNISIGSNDCTVDLYNIRVYKNSLTRFQIVDNWIADTQDIEEKIDRYTRNNVYDAYGGIVIANLPTDLPYMVLEGEALPQYKGNELTINGEFTNPIYPSKSFKFIDGTIDVQGTSSAEYARKNYLLTLTNGLTQNGTLKEDYQMRDNSIATNCFCFKADVASSEGANNVELVRLYNDVSPFKTLPQQLNPLVRQGIDGFPMVIFYNDGDVTEFIGKYNFNNDKSTHEVFGLDAGDESWEIRNNTSDRVIWKSADYSGTDWKNDFKARYPEDNGNISTLKRFAEWVVSTDRTQATNAALPALVTYGDNLYSQDTAEYRLDKFKYELEDYAELNSALFYYLFTELFLMVDSRAKNAFPSWIDTDKVCWLPYDMDTAIGINNEGALVYGYQLEDIDKTESGANVYNGQDSVFWCNLRDCFGEELKEMYQELRSKDLISYDIVENAFEEHQSVWPEAIWNEDAYYKYLQPLIDDGAGIYLPMLQGSKSEQRKWWLYNRFRYIDSKYNAGDALTDVITLRGYAKDDITITPYADIYASIKYGSYLVQERALRGGSYTLDCPLDTLNDTEIYIYSASQLKDVGDISGLKVGLADFSKATRLQNLKIGDSSTSYSNGNLNSLTLGNNTLLKTIDVRNCTALGTGEQQSLDLSGCSNIEEVYLTGTALKGVTLPNGGVLKTLHLPNTINNLTICNQPSLTDVVLNDYSNITTLRLENVGSFESDKIVRSMQSGGRVRLLDVYWDLDNSDICKATFNKLATMKGLDESGNNIDDVQLTGTVIVSAMCSSSVPAWQEKYPNVNFIWTPLSLNGCTWAEIAQICAEGKAADTFQIGDEKVIELTTGEQVTLVIYGFNHDDLADGTGKASITFGTKDCLATSYIIYDSDSADYSRWDKCTMRTTHLPTIYNTLPSDLQSIIKPVYKNSATSSVSSTIQTLEETLFLLSAVEVLGTRYQKHPEGSGAVYAYDGEGTQYDYFKQSLIPVGSYFLPKDEGATTGTFYNSNADEWQPFINRLGNEVDAYCLYYANYNAVKGGTSSNYAAGEYWLRSARNQGASSSTSAKRVFWTIINNGALYGRTMQTTGMGVSFCFCI